MDVWEGLLGAIDLSFRGYMLPSLTDRTPWSEFLPGETQTMVRVNCQNGDGGGSWVGEKNGSDSAGPVPVRFLHHPEYDEVP